MAITSGHRVGAHSFLGDVAWPSRSGLGEVPWIACRLSHTVIVVSPLPLRFGEQARRARALPSRCLRSPTVMSTSGEVPKILFSGQRVICSKGQSQCSS